MQVAGLVGRHEKSLETFAACPAPDNPLVAFLGNEGCVPLVSLRSRQCVGDLKMSGTVRTAAFSSDGQELLTSGALNVSISKPRMPTHMLSFKFVDVSMGRPVHSSFALSCSAGSLSDDQERVTPQACVHPCHGLIISPKTLRWLRKPALLALP